MPTCPQCLGAFDDGSAVCPHDGATLVVSDGAMTLPPGGPAPETARTLGLSGETGARYHPENDALIGLTLAGRYQIVRRLGQGGMGAVYEAAHAVIGRRVALKVLHERYMDRPEVAARLMNEARLASSIHNEHIVDIFDFGETSDGRTFVVMELLEGESLAQLLRREGPLPESRALAICLQVSDALGAAHERGIIHRDVKPENVFVLRRDGTDFAKMLDFGISKAMRPDGAEAARLTHTGMVLGTPLYMSPEQARGEEAIDHRIDVYALGVILYEALTGSVPFRGSNYLGIISDVLSRAPVPLRQARPDLHISESAELAVLRAMAKERERRYASMTELGEDLRRALAGKQLPPLPAPASSGPHPHGRSLYAAIAAILVVVLLTTALVTRRSTAPGRSENGAAIATARAAAAPRPAPGSPPRTDVVQALPTVHVWIESTPPGAAILDGARDLGRTPARLALPAGSPLTLTLRLPGYADGSLAVLPRSEGEHVPITLGALARDHHRRRDGSRIARGARSPRSDRLPVTELKYR